MIVDIQNDLALLDSMNLLDSLLTDKTTGKSILWATDAYSERGRQYDKASRITRESLIPEGILRTRAQKESAQQDARTRQHAEVFTPLWVVRKMNDYADKEWFGYPDVFFKDGKPVPDKIRFWDNRKIWKDYVDSRRLEITCGEAPFLVTRYDVETGEILPVRERAGILDRKLRVVGENTDTERAWITWAARAVEATYGYEFQGDSLLIARLNVLMTVRDFMEDRFGQTLTEKQFGRLIQTVVWNLWQMDGLTDRIPFAAEEEPDMGGLLFGMMQEQENTDCRIYDWRTGLDVPFYKLKEDLYKVGEKSMKFDFIIGNPPYQDETLGDNKGFAPPIYDKFMDASFSVSDKVELIHPARFLFDAGSTPKSWNQKMLNDPHFIILHYEQVASKLFPDTDIKGGVVISYRDSSRYFGKIEVFTPFDELNKILRKVVNRTGFSPLSEIMYNQTRFDLPSLYRDHPEYMTIIGSDGKDRRFRNNIFDKVHLFTEQKTYSDDVKVLGVVSNKRNWRFIPRKYVDTTHENLERWKLLVVRVNGTGVLGEVLSPPVVSKPNEGYTQTFIGIGAYDTEQEALNTLKYVKSKFLRTMLSTLKITQDNSIETWRMIPLQDFTPSSDIDWTKSIPEIDRQLYAKYGLDESEIEFIETHVKEMT